MTESNLYRIAVSVRSEYLADQSDPEGERYVFAYHVTLRNEGTVAAQLISRHWIITDAGGQQQEVKGKGVVGEQPEILPGDSYEYTSGVPLPTSSGFMRGTYGMIDADGRAFDVEIPAFSLDAPSLRRTLN